tara:strand:- start:9 stop:152 length:144 start_codon:yes stop_codon:yes gene_type:complete
MFAWFKRDTVQKRKFKLAREAKERRLAIKEEKRLELMKFSSWDINTK